MFFNRNAILYFVLNFYLGMLNFLMEFFHPYIDNIQNFYVKFGSYKIAVVLLNINFNFDF